MKAPSSTPALQHAHPPAPRSSVELVTTGAELLSGRTVNRHAQTLGAALAPLGLRLVRDTTVPDDLAAIVEAIRGALARVDLVIVSGGLGPTSDDVTRDALGAIAGRTLVMDAEALRRIVDRYTRSGRAMNASVERHALVLEGAAVLQNSDGLAPGERLDLDGKTVFLLPGPPREFQSVLNEHVLPWLRAHAAGTPPAVRLFQVCGIGESDIVTRLTPLGFPPPGLDDVAYCAQPGRVEIRLSAPPAQQAALEQAARQVRDGLGANIFAEARVELAAVVAQLLLARGATLATAESCTGGLVGHRLTNLSGSSAWYLGGVVAYANASKVRDLGVPAATIEREGAVSEATARAMAEGVRARFGSDFGLAVTGIAGPTGGTPEKPVGLVWMAVADARGTAAWQRRFAGSRDVNKDWASQMAIDLLRRRLQGVESHA